MYHKISEFTEDWKSESDTTKKVFANLTNESLKVKVTPDGRELGFIAWHIVVTIVEMMHKGGLEIDSPAEDSDPPKTAKEIHDTYENVAGEFLKQVSEKWTDEMMNDDVELYGQKWKRWLLLSGTVKHEIHHRGQMTVLMRQAGLKVPGAYGPSKEEWSAYGMPVAK
ncbi:MAG: DinB family protein [Ignavibacteria bacterium]|jgi:uncharacterized damage-inducible protein DinB|nr:DinB family protein [Ignavibacteria bacterium]